MASEVKTVRLEAAYLGVDTDSSPNAVDKRKAQVLQNYLTGEKGRIRQRGPITSSALGLALDANSGVAGSMYGKNAVAFGFKDRAETTAVIEPWVAPYKVAGGSTGLAKPALDGSADGTLRVIDLINGTVTDRTIDTGIGVAENWLIPGPRSTRFGRFVYTISYSARFVCINPRGGVEWDTSLTRWNSDSLFTAAPVSYGGGGGGTANAPFAAQDLRIHYNRLLMLGGSEPGESMKTTPGDPSSIYPNTIWFTRALTNNDHDYGISTDRSWPGNVPGLTNDDVWEDELSGATNRLDLPGNRDDFGVAFGKVGRALAVFQRHNIVLLSGFGPSTWQLRQAVEGIGCVDPRSIIETGEGCFFLSDQGFMFYDGSTLSNAGRGVQRDLLEAGLEAVGTQDHINGGFAIGTWLSNEYIMLTIGYEAFAATPLVPVVTFCGLYHIPSDSWDLFTSGTMNTTGAAPTRIGRTENISWIASDWFAGSGDSQGKLFTVPYLTVPGNATEAQRGQDTTAGGNTNIETKWRTRTIELSQPFRKAQLNRILIDYEWVVDGASDEAHTGPTVTVYDQDGTSLDSYTLPSGPADPPPGITRKRHQRDLYAEASAIYVTIEYSSTVRALVRSAVHDIWVEYQEAQEADA